MAEQVERHQLLQEQQRGAGEPGRLLVESHCYQHAFHTIHHDDVAEVDALVGILRDAERIGGAPQVAVGRPEAPCKAG